MGKKRWDSLLGMVKPSMNCASLFKSRFSVLWWIFPVTVFAAHYIYFPMGFHGRGNWKLYWVNSKICPTQNPWQGLVHFSTKENIKKLLCYHIAQYKSDSS